MHDGVPDSVSPKAELAPRWLEEITDPKTASWVAQHNESTRQLLGSPSLNTLVSEIRDLLDNPDRMPVVTDHHGMLYNLWTDAAHPRGLWRRTTWESYVQGAPQTALRQPRSGRSSLTSMPSQPGKGSICPGQAPRFCPRDPTLADAL